ncbi:helix-turn-helix domain-containing protein [Vagococcus elongatus]|nr:helix-turn-helix domain-containing protein [Vagococcus elongatus]
MNRIQELRKEAKLTQNELAKLIGVNPVTLSRYENNERNPKVDKLEKMSEIFTASIPYITGESDSRLGLNNGDYAKTWDELASKMNSHNNSNIFLTESETKQKLIEYFDKLNSVGKNEALKQVINLSKISDYTE